MNTVTINYGKICWHDHATKTIGPTTHQINWYCPDCGYTRTTYPTPGDSADAPVQQAGGERMSFEKAMVAAGYNKPERGAHANSGYLYQRDEDRFVGWELRAALKGEQPVEHSGSERGNAA